MGFGVTTFIPPTLMSGYSTPMPQATRLACLLPYTNDKKRRKGDPMKKESLRLNKDHFLPLSSTPRRDGLHCHYSLQKNCRHDLREEEARLWANHKWLKCRLSYICPLEIFHYVYQGYKITKCTCNQLQSRQIPR